MRRFAILSLLLTLAVPLQAAVPPKAVELHHKGLAELENESPENAERAYREVIKLVPDDPLGYVNLSIALLRQQKYDVAARVLNFVPEDLAHHPRILGVRGELRQWTGDLEGALDVLAEAAEVAGDDLEVLYAAYQLASNLKSEKAAAVKRQALERLAELRPENVVVLLQLGQRSIADGDRAGATAAYQRVGELLWQAQPMAQRAFGMLEEALKKDDLSAARVPAVRVENVLKVSPMFRESLRELKTGIQGIPMERFATEPPVESFGEPIPIELAGTRLDERPSAGRGLVAGDFDGDERPDLARLRRGEPNVLEIRLAAAGWKVSSEHPVVPADADELLLADLTNDGHLDLVAFGARGAAAWLGQADGTFTAAADQLGLAAAGAAAATVLDFDVEGDLDLVLAGRASGAGDLWRNSLQGPLEQVGTKALPNLKLSGARGLAASDLDRDGDLDLAIAHAGGLTWLANLRQGQLTEQPVGGGAAERGAAERGAAERGPAERGPAMNAVVAADLTNDGLPELVAVGDGFNLWRNGGGSFTAWRPAGLPAEGHYDTVVAFDASNDGRYDLAAAGPEGVVVFTQDAAGGFVAVELAEAPAKAQGLAAADLDQDGDLDLAVGGPEGLHWLENKGGNKNGYLALRLRGLTKGSSKNNVFGVGSVVEVRTGVAYQYREAAGDVLHLGLGSQKTADVVRIVWTNGVPQNRLAVAGNQRVVEEQLLKGSCPFLYAWDGEGFAFVTDLLWASPIGLPLAPGVWAPSDPGELVRVDGLVDDGGVYRLRLTEELWEAAFFDHVRLWVVDHPAEVEVASNLRVRMGEVEPERVLASRELRPVAAAWDGEGRDVTELVRHRDEVYADGYAKSPYQGVAERPWSFTFDLGEAPGTAVRLHLDGWIFPSDASLNLAVAQRDDLAVLPPRLLVETAGGWRELVASTGFPAGKTKTMVLDTPPLPEGARRLRIETSLWLHWDRIAWTTKPADDQPRVVARLLPSSANLRFRGFSAAVRHAPNAPHVFDYQRTRLASPWLPFPGRYTRFGDVRELLREADDFSVVLASGDEIAVTFDASHLPPPAPGFVRTLFLESHGWDKDADRNTWEGQQLEPLPFRAMSGYPYVEGEEYPDTPAHRAYRREWLTRDM